MSLFTHLSTIQKRGGYRSGPAWAVCKSSPTPLQAFQDSWQRVPWRVLAMPHSAVGNEHLAKNPWDPPTPSNLREWRSVAWEGGETECVCRRGRGNNAGNYKRVLRQQKMEIIIDLPTIKNCTFFFSSLSLSVFSFPICQFVIFWPFVQTPYLATFKLLPNIWKNWLPFLWSLSIGLHSSYSLYTVPHSHIYFPHFFVYIQFYHISSHFSPRVKPMLCSNTHYSLLFLTLHFLLIV